MIRNQKGFTLIELMVVVLIIGILVAIAIPVFGSAANNAKDKACIANLRTIAGAVAQYQAEWNPSADITIAQLVNGGFIKETPEDPHGAYSYAISAAEVVSIGAGHPANDSKGVAFPTF